MKKTFLIISVLIVTLFSVFTNPLVNAADGWVIDGDTVYIDDSQVYLSATPHTLTASGWVEFELLSKNYSGDIDIVLGVDTEDNITFKKPERWKEDVPHTVVEWVPAELQGEITLCDISDYEYWQIEDYTGEIDVGNYNNLYVANVTYQDCFNPDPLTYNRTIAFYDYEWLNSEHTSAVLYYNYDGQIREYHTEYYDDWDTLNVDFTSSYYQWSDVTVWYHAALDISITADTLYKARVWADIPFNGLNSISGKYYWAVKPSGETIQQAILNNHLYFLDPWYDSSWNYREQFEIDGTVDGAQTDYPIALTVHYGNGVDSGSDVYLDSKCKADFGDLRFTEDDGTTLIPYWIEEYTDSTDATVWINFSYIPASPGSETYMIYFGNAGASTTSNGYDTFTFFDDFERGNDGDTIGGDWTEVTPHVHISTDQDIGDVSGYFGTRSAKAVGNDGGSAAATIPVTASEDIAIRMRYWKDTDGYTAFYHGDGSTLISAQGFPDENWYVHDGVSWVDTTLNVLAENWGLMEWNNFDWTAQTMTAVIDGSTKTGIDISRAHSSWEDVFLLYGNANDNFHKYIDDVIVRKWAATEPTFGDWGSEQQLAVPTVTTGNASNIDCDSFDIWGNITDDGYGTITTIGFYYGSGNLTSNVTDSYSTDNFTLNISGLSENTTYLVQAFAINEKGIGTGSTINVTTTVCQFCASPTDLRLSELSDNRIYIEWSSVDNVTGYLILVSNVEYPDDPEDQYGYAVAYSGNDTSAILEGYETDINEYFFSLWTHCNPYSEEYVTASIGGESLDELAISVHDIGLLFISMVPLIFFSVIAFWKENSIMFGLSAGISIAVGFYCYDVDSNPFMLGISILLWVYSVICLIFGLMCMFKRRPVD